MNIGWSKLPGHRLCEFAVLLALWLPLVAFGQAQALDQFLDKDGQLAVPAGFAGSLDPAGFELQSTADGSPRFLPRGDGAAVPGEWETFGGVNSGCDGDVYAIAIDAAGLIYLGGQFRSCGNTWANSVVAYNPVTNDFHSLGSGEENGVPPGHLNVVRSLAVSGGDLYVGGQFIEAGGLTANNLARWDGSQWHALESDGQIGLGSYVFSMAVSEDGVFVGGGGPVRRWDGNQWHLLLGDGHTTGGVRALAVSGDDVFVGSGSGVRRFDGSEWHNLDDGDGGISGTVRGLAVLGNDLYAGGVFHEADGQTVNNVARWDGSQWHAMESGGQTGLQGHSGTPVYDLAVAGGSVYVSGEFVEAGGQTANHVVRWDGNEWHALESGGQNGVTGLVRPSAFALTVSGDDVYVGGDFGRAGGQVANRVARWDGSQWHALESDGQGVSGFIRAMAVSGSDVYVGGRFTSAGDQLATNVARWDGSQWHSLGSGEQNGAGPGDVFAVAVSGDDVYIGGNFGYAGGQSASSVARWDGSHWHWLESGFQVGVNAPVRALAVSGNDVYVGGLFTEAGGQTANRIARWDGSQWQALISSDGHNGVGSPVSALAVAGNDLYVGLGQLGAPGGHIGGLLRWDGSQWHNLGSGTEGGNLAIYALAVSGDDVYAGGFIFQAGSSDQDFNGVARWDGSQWHALGSGKHTGVNAFVTSLAVSGGNVYVGGDFNEAGGQLANHVARWDGSQWASLGGGNENGVQRTGVDAIALAAAGPAIYVGGWNNAAGGELSHGFASFTLVDEIFRDGFVESPVGSKD